MLTIDDVVRPSLLRLVRQFAPDEPRSFWQLFELLTRESLTLPLSGDSPRFSGICADGTPWQFCISLGAGTPTTTAGGLRYLTEIGRPGAPMSDRVSLSRRRLDEVMTLLQLPPESAAVVDALFGLLPKPADGLDSLFGAIWIGVRAANGKLDIRLYANNEWGDELARWRRLTEALRTLRAAGFARLLRVHVADLTGFFSAAGLAASLGPTPLLKLYLRPRANPWDACERLIRHPGFQLPTGLLSLVDHALGEPLHGVSERVLVLSIGGTVDGDRPDLKLDLNSQYLSPSAHPPAEAVEALAAACDIDVAPYRQTLAILRDTAPPDFEPVHDFIGIGGGSAGMRLNVYVRPPTLQSRPAHRAVPSCGVGNTSQSAASERAVQALLAAQSADGSWTDFHLPVGRGSSWVTAYVGRALLSLPEAAAVAIHHSVSRAAQSLATARRPAGWGFNTATEPDADSTALAILLLRQVHGPAPWMRSTLHAFRRPDGSYGTFRRVDHDNQWSAAHADVLPTVLEALNRRSRDAARLILRRRAPNGEWRSYWWTTGLYAAATSLRFLARTDLRAHRAGSRDWLLETARPRDPFVAALGLLALSQLDPDPAIRTAKSHLLRMLLDAQRPDGLWPPAAGLCVPPFSCDAPWDSPRDVRIFADSGLFTTATALWALSESRTGEQ